MTTEQILTGLRAAAEHLDEADRAGFDAKLKAAGYTPAVG